MTAVVPKPVGKVNLIYPTIANHLLTNGQTTRVELRTKKDKKITVVNPVTSDRYQIQTYIDYPITVPVPTLAGNVSQLNVDRFIERVGV